jgi:hypothetical protein
MVGRSNSASLDKPQGVAGAFDFPDFSRRGLSDRIKSRWKRGRSSIQPSPIELRPPFFSRREVLGRLLKLNHQGYAEEVAKGLHEKKGPRNTRK